MTDIKLTDATTQEGLNAVVTRRINEKIMRSEETVKATLERFISEGRIQKDFIANIGVGRRGISPDITFGANGSILMFINNEEYHLHPHAVNQIAYKLNIPAKYLTGLATGEEWERQLCQKILNDTSLFTMRERVLIRSVGNDVRGVLSDRYKRLNSMIILTSFFREVEKNDGRLVDGFMDDTRTAFEAIYPTPIELVTPKNGTILMTFGAKISNSDYGDGALSMRSFTMQGVCLNGMVRENVLNQVHLGVRLPDNIEFSNHTYELETQASSSAVGDITRQLFAPSTVKKRMEEIIAASSKEVDAEKELKRLNQNSQITKVEGDEVMKVLVNNKIEDGVAGESTLWKLVNGITAVARDKDERRKRELQEIAGNLMPVV